MQGPGATACPSSASRALACCQHPGQTLPRRPAVATPRGAHPQRHRRRGTAGRALARGGGGDSAVAGGAGGAGADEVEGSGLQIADAPSALSRIVEPIPPAQPVPLGVLKCMPLYLLMASGHCVVASRLLRCRWLSLASPLRLGLPLTPNHLLMYKSSIGRRNRITADYGTNIRILGDKFCKAVLITHY